jgi:hypothetical protein
VVLQHVLQNNIIQRIKIKTYIYWCAYLYRIHLNEFIPWLLNGRHSATTVYVVKHILTLIYKSYKVCKNYTKCPYIKLFLKMALNKLVHKMETYLFSSHGDCWKYIWTGFRRKYISTRSYISILVERFVSKNSYFRENRNSTTNHCKEEINIGTVLYEE